MDTSDTQVPISIAQRFDELAQLRQQLGLPSICPEEHEAINRLFVAIAITAMGKAFYSIQVGKREFRPALDYARYCAALGETIYPTNITAPEPPIQQ